MTLRRNRQLVAALACFVCLAGAVGCSGPGLDLAAKESPLPADESSAEYLDRISSQTSVSENDAMRGILLLLDGKDSAGGFAERLRILRQRGIVPARWDCRPQRPLSRGRMAYMIYQACKVPGGVMLTLIGPTQRYCLRELQYREIIGPGAMYVDVGGMEFQAVLSRADHYLETGEVPDVIAAGEQ